MTKDPNALLSFSNVFVIFLMLSYAGIFLQMVGQPHFKLFILNTWPSGINIAQLFKS